MSPRIGQCKGDSVKWIMVKAGPHNVVFDEEAVPEGVNAAGLSMLCGADGIGRILWLHKALTKDGGLS